MCPCQCSTPCLVINGSAVLRQELGVELQREAADVLSNEPGRLLHAVSGVVTVQPALTSQAVPMQCAIQLSSLYVQELLIHSIK